MLQAKNEYGKMVTPALLTRQDIANERHKPFSCPICQQPVILKAGSKMIAHFAHRSSRDCPNQDQGEGRYHEEGKLLLYQWLRRQFSHTVLLEKWLPDIQQRPDIYLTIGERQIAIEFQCARMSLEQIAKRNKGYQNRRITPIWILGASHLKRIQQHHIRLSPFTKQFIHDFFAGHPPVLYFFNPHSAELVIMKDLYEVNPSQAIGQLSFNRIHELSFSDLFKANGLSLHTLLTLWEKEKRRFRLTVPQRLYGNNLVWHQWLYEKRSHRDRLPAIVYLPVSSQHLMITPLWNWQSRLCLDFLIPLPVGHTFTLQQCIRLLNNHIFPQIRSTQLKPTHKSHPIKQYLQWFIHLNMITEVSPNVFVKQLPILEPDHIEASLRADQQLLQKLYEKLSAIEA
ncbi:competence protein CoiA [Lentibacillus saliphilus]|uniref:competence protein CoiA n=1 Tax=Lentibacillus saliphilus TaxID=2737028 RepID=UPI001C309FCC|nr:competence protein CoiA family protein [Lentibacillus saliphilus]